MGLLNDKIRRAGFSDNPWNVIDDSNLFSKLNRKTGSRQGSALRRTSSGIAASFPASRPIGTFFMFILKLCQYILGYILIAISLSLLHTL